MDPFRPKFTPLHSYVYSYLLKLYVGVGPFQILVIKLSSNKYGDVGNLQEFEY